MFEFLSMADNYKERLIKNTKINGAEIDTVAVNDSDEPYETGIQHPSYNEGSWVIVEMYETKELAKAGHDKWVEIFKKELPSELKDVSTSDIAQLAEAAGCDIREPKNKMLN